MWFILVTGVATLVGAGLFARRPDELRLATLRALSIATLLMSCAGFTAGVALTFASLGRIPAEHRADWHLYALKGISESSANLILAFTLLALAWLVIAIGLRRLGAKAAS